MKQDTALLPRMSVARAITIVVLALVVSVLFGVLGRLSLDFVALPDGSLRQEMLVGGRIAAVASFTLALVSWLIPVRLVLNRLCDVPQ